MARVTAKKLEALCEVLNDITDSPASIWETDPKTGKYRQQPGHWYISQAYGGYSLVRVANPGGGVSSYLEQHHVPARDLYNQIRALIDGIRIGKDLR